MEVSPAYGSPPEVRIFHACCDLMRAEKIGQFRAKVQAFILKFVRMAEAIGP